jgi:hypothetical protein
MNLQIIQKKIGHEHPSVKIYFAASESMCLIRVKMRTELLAGIDERILERHRILKMNIVITRSVYQQEVPL